MLVVKWLFLNVFMLKAACAAVNMAQSDIIQLMDF